MHDLVSRMLRAARLDQSLYGEVTADEESMTQAMGVVAIAAVASGIAMGYAGLGGFVVGITWRVASWLVASVVMYYVGTRWFADQETQADYPRLLRALGFAASPGVVHILGAINGLRGLAFWVASLWMVATASLAVRDGLRYSTTGRAVVVSLLGFVVQLIVVLLFRLGGCARLA